MFPRGLIFDSSRVVPEGKILIRFFQFISHISRSVGVIISRDIQPHEWLSILRRLESLSHPTLGMGRSLHLSDPNSPNVAWSRIYAMRRGYGETSIDGHWGERSSVRKLARKAYYLGLKGSGGRM